MGSLIFASDLRDSGISDRITWYFKGARRLHRYNTGNFVWKFDISETYPYKCMIHHDHLKTDNVYDVPETQSRRVDIREWVMHCCLNDVVYDYLDMRYTFQERSPTWDSSGRRRVDHGYHMFYFLNEDEATSFAFAFADIVTDKILEYHPDFQLIDKTTIRPGTC